MHFKSTYLVQRLNRPYPNHENNPFTFGGGLENGGLSKDGMSLLKQFFSFEYMGAAEYEWGAIPKTLNQIAKNVKEYVTTQMIINKMPVYIISHKDAVDKVKETLVQLSKNKIHTKGYNAFDSALGLNKYSPKENCKTIGWLELDNDFMFFTEVEPFNGIVQLYGIK